MTPQSNNVALITGAARRIGRALALDLAAHGWSVAIHYRRSKDAAEALVDEIVRQGGRAAAIQADLAIPHDLAQLVSHSTKAIGAPTCLINNASEFQPDSVLTLTPETWDRHMNINLKAPVFLARAMAEALPDGVEGNVINIVDQRVWNLTADFFSYTLSKAGLWTATRTLAQALAPRIRVNAIGPGPVLQSIHQTPDEFAAEAAATLLKRVPKPEEIAAAARFILGSPTLTGQMIALDSGQHLS